MHRHFVPALILALLWVPPISSDTGVGTVPDPELRNLLREAAQTIGTPGDHFDAWVWLADMSRRLEKKIPDAHKRIALLRHVHNEAARAGLEPELVLSVIHVESDFDTYAISSSGARGLMQVMPFWLKEIGRAGDSLFDVKTNLRYGCTILRYYLDKEHGHRPNALARYNGSVGQKKYPALVYQTWNRFWYRQ